MITQTARSASCALCLILLAGRAEARDDNQLWTTATATVKVSEQFRLTQEFTARISDNRNGLYQVEAVTMLGYKPSNTVHDGSWRRIKVRVTPATNEAKLQASYKRGYSAPGR